MLVKVVYDDKSEESIDIPKRNGADALQQAAQQVTTRQRRKPEKRVVVSLTIAGPDPEPGVIRDDGKWRTFADLNPTEQQDVRKHLPAKEIADAGDDEYVHVNGRWAHVPSKILHPVTPTPAKPVPGPTPNPPADPGGAASR